MVNYRYVIMRSEDNSKAETSFVFYYSNIHKVKAIKLGVIHYDDF
jgi:hypothetical protein